MRAAEEALRPVRDFRGLAYARKWRETLHFARQQQTNPPSGVARASAFKAIDRPVFVLGSPRSGTTYLGSLLAELPSSTYFYEPPVLKYLARRVYSDRRSQFRNRLAYDGAVRALLLAAPGSGPRVVEKNPNHTWVVEALAEAFPGSQFVGIIRDGRDVAVSLREKPWHRRDRGGELRREPGGYLTGPYPHFYIEPQRRLEYATTSDIHRCGWIWRRHTEELVRLRSVLPANRYREVRYEDLLRSPAVEVPSLLDWLGERDTASQAPVLKAAKAGHLRSIGRWKLHLEPDEQAIIDHECGSLLRRLGYG